jgi:hypothetical protein
MSDSSDKIPELYETENILFEEKIIYGDIRLRN